MQNKLYIVGVEKAITEYAEKLVKLIKVQDIDVEFLTFNKYKKISSLGDILFVGARFIFIGINSLGQPALPSILVWEYERFGCRIGWVRNKCVIFARDTDLQYSDYKDFRDYCKSVQLENPDVIIPPENPIAEGVECLKKLFAHKNNHSAHRAQYSTLVYEFMNNYLVKFVSSDDGGEEGEPNDEVPKDINDILRNLKGSALANLTLKQAIWCHAIIHATALSCAVVAFIPIPVADIFPITAAQVSMVIALGKVFHNKLTKSDAQVLLKTVTAPLAGRALAKVGLILIPGIGWTINGAIAGTITEILGWTIANDFASKQKK